MAQYANIPGVNMNVLDGQMMLGQNNSANSVLIIADVNAPSRVEVPVEPVLVQNEAQLREHFGGFFNRGAVNPIAAEWASVYRQGLRNIYLLGLQGADEKQKFINLQETLFETMADLSIEHVVLAGMYADQVIEVTAADFNAAGLEEVEGVEGWNVRTGAIAAADLTEAGTLTLVVDSIELPLNVTKTKVADVIDELNREAQIAISENVANVEIEFSVDAANIVTMRASKPTTVGEDLTGIMIALGLEDATTGLVDEVFVGEGTPGGLLGAYAERHNREIGETLCYISVKPPVSTSLTDIKNWHTALISRKNEIHPAVQVVAGPQVGIQLPGSLRTQWVSGATQYALLVQSLPAAIAPTNQALPQAQNLRVNLSMAQINKLAGNKYVTFRMKNNAITVVDAITSAPDLYVGQDIVRSDFTRLSTLRSVNYITRRLRVALDAYIGQPNEFAVYNSMRSSIKSEIRDAIDNLIIQDASFSIVLGDSFDTAVVKLTILPQFELRRIDVTIGLATPDNFEGGLAE